MRPNKVKTAVQCSVCPMWVLAEFSSHGNLINSVSIPLLYICNFFLFLFVIGPKREKSKYFKMNSPTKRFVFFKELTTDENTI